jgi:transcriptional regulator GlxA family with amidase domain
MKKLPVYFVLPPHLLLLDLAGPAEALCMANRYQDNVRFELHYAGPATRVTSSIGLKLAAILPLPKKLAPHAMIVVAGAADPTNDRTTDAARMEIVKWLRRIANPNRRMVFICSGALLAAQAGLLDHRACTTHHTDCDELERTARDAKVHQNRIYVIDGNIYTSAGVTAGTDLMLHIISEIAGPLCTIAVARNMVVYMRRSGSDPQLSPWLDGRNHIHPVVHRLQDAIATDPAHPWNLEELARLGYASPRHIVRLFREHTGSTPLEYINRLRIAVAKQLLMNSQLGVEDVADRAGFGSTRHFRRVWLQYIAVPPSYWREHPTEIRSE